MASPPAATNYYKKNDCFDLIRARPLSKPSEK